MKKTITIYLAFILLISTFFIVTTECVKAETLHVGAGQTYSTIQAAIDAAKQNDTVFVHSGTYNEIITITKTINLTGEGSSTTTISGIAEHTIKISSNNVNISGFKIQNTGSTSGFYCVFLDSVSDCIISDNTIRSGGHGIYLGLANNNLIEDNTIEYNNVGIYFSESEDNTVKSNIIHNNGNGIFIPSLSSGNTMYLNDFSGNMDQNARDYSDNNWDFNDQGNYWSDYNNYDLDGDGIGDQPYDIPGGTNKDNYPLGYFLSINQKPIAYIDSITPNPAYKGQTVNFVGRGVDDKIVSAWEWKSDDKIISTSASFSSSSFSKGSHSIKFRVKDNDGQWSDPVYKTLVISYNQKPTAYILKPTNSSVKFGEIIEFLGEGTDQDGEVTNCNWSSNPPGVSSTSYGFSLSDLPVGNYTIFFKVKDDYGDWSAEATKTFTVLSETAGNEPPVAIIEGPYTSLVNQMIIFNGSESYDPNPEDILIYTWDFGDGTTGADSITNHTYSTTGTYTVKLTVTDGYGLQSNNSTTVIINQTPDSNNPDKNTPGFEFIFVILGTLFVLFFRKKIFKL